MSAVCRDTSSRSESTGRRYGLWRTVAAVHYGGVRTPRPECYRQRSWEAAAITLKTADILNMCCESCTTSAVIVELYYHKLIFCNKIILFCACSHDNFQSFCYNDISKEQLVNQKHLSHITISNPSWVLMEILMHTWLSKQVYDDITKGPVFFTKHGVYYLHVRRKNTKIFFVISPVKLGRVENLVYSFLNKFDTKSYKRFPPYLNFVSTILCKTLSRTCYHWVVRKSNSKIYLASTVASKFARHEVCWLQLVGILREKVYKTRITDLIEIHQRRHWRMAAAMTT